MRSMELKDSIPNTTPAGAAQNWSGTVYPIGGIAQGSLVNQRVGDSVTMRRLEFVPIWYGNAGATAPVTGRLIIFTDSMNPGSAPTASELLDIGSLGTLGAPAAAFNAFNRQQKRFNILYDQMTSIPTGGYLLDTPARDVRKIKIPMNITTTFSGAGATTYGRHSLWMLAVCDVNVNDPTLYVQAQLFYTDS
jgi:hypothetical protein